MKQMLIDIMAAMMPYMKTPVFIGAGLGAVGVVLLAMKLFIGKGPLLGVVAWLLIALGGFYIVSQLMGLYLGMTPTINFGDPRKFEFNTVEFWKIGAGFLVSGVIYLVVAKRQPA